MNEFTRQEVIQSCRDNGNMKCVLHPKELDRHIFKHTDGNWYAICLQCGSFDEDELYSYDGFCATCLNPTYGCHDPTLCYMCGRLACLACEYSDDYFEEALCGACSKRANDESFKAEYKQKRDDDMKRTDNRKGK